MTCPQCKEKLRVPAAGAGTEAKPATQAGAPSKAPPKVPPPEADYEVVDDDAPVKPSAITPRKKPPARTRAEEADDDVEETDEVLPADEDDQDDADEDEEERPRRKRRRRRRREEPGLTTTEYTLYTLLFLIIPCANVLVSSILYYVWRGNSPPAREPDQYAGFSRIWRPDPIASRDLFRLESVTGNAHEISPTSPQLSPGVCSSGTGRTDFASPFRRGR